MPSKKPDDRRPWCCSGPALLASLLLVASACKDEPGPAPAASAAPRDQDAATSATSAPCDAPRKVNDPSNVQLFPPTTDGFCLDPHGSDRGFGEGAKRPVDEICELFDGECAIYQGFDVRRVVEVRYIDGEGSGATIDVKLSTFGDAGKAYAMFTKRVVGDGDPAHPDRPRPIEAGSVAALGWSNAFVWRGTHLAEITYNDISGASDRQLKDKADKLLPPLAAALGKKLSGKPGLPPAAAGLPAQDQLPLGVRFVTEDALGIAGAGEAAYGYYKTGEQRWRVLSIVRDEAAGAKDVLATLRRQEGAAVEKRLGDGGVHLMVKLAGAQTEWLIARKGERLVGIGDEPRVLREGMDAEEYRRKSLSLDDKRKKLETMLESL
ncbi:MAG: hypothetical protein KC731_05300 [Myxococcales bacterium]|nr:hypothetical protein [Myxococcales bacterium]